MQFQLVFSVCNFNVQFQLVISMCFQFAILLASNYAVHLVISVSFEFAFRLSLLIFYFRFQFRFRFSSHFHFCSVSLSSVFSVCFFFKKKSMSFHLAFSFQNQFYLISVISLVRVLGFLSSLLAIGQQSCLIVCVCVDCL
jgi:hypothetical protein